MGSIITVAEIKPGMIIRDYWTDRRRTGSQARLVVAGAEIGLGPCSGIGYGYLFTSPDRPGRQLLWGGALADVEFWHEKTVDLAEVGVDLEAVAAEVAAVNGAAR